MEREIIYEVDENRTVSVGDWFITLILLSIPLVGFILELVWAFGGGAPKSKSNWAKAILIIQVLGVILMILFWSAIAGSLAALGMFE